MRETDTTSDLLKFFREKKKENCLFSIPHLSITTQPNSKTPTPTPMNYIKHGEPNSPTLAVRISHQASCNTKPTFPKTTFRTIFFFMSIHQPKIQAPLLFLTDFSAIGFFIAIGLFTMPSSARLDFWLVISSEMRNFLTKISSVMRDSSLDSS